MSEIKRAQLIPLGAQKECEKPSTRKTIRLQVTLPESTEDTCPEFNYKDELAAALKKTEQPSASPGTVPNGVNGLDDVLDENEEEDDDVRRIARQMEEKYGTGPSQGKKKRKGRKDDYADIGMGYDESDSFIDNTDGYDEMIPHNVTTIHGGFYINSGALEFKTDDEVNSDFSSSSSDDNDDEENTKKPNSRKRIIESSDETDQENKTESVDNHIEKKRKFQNGGSCMQSSMKKKLLGQNEIYIKKRRLIDPHKKTVKQLLREKREDLNMSIPSELGTPDGAQPEVILVGEEPAEIEDAGKKPPNSSVSDIIESVVKASFGGTQSQKVEEIRKVPKPPTITSSSDGESSHDASSITRMEVRLPENLSTDIVDIISTIKSAALKGADTKGGFTNSEVNRLILSLQRQCKCLGKPSKMKVYEHLSFYMKCKTEKLIRHAKNLVLEDDQKKLNKLLIELQREVSKIMSVLLDNYEKETRKVLAKKFSADGVDNDESKSIRMPKRRFQWNDVSKQLVKDALLQKKRCLLLEGKSKDSIDTFMTAFMKSELQVLWPDRWMAMGTLNKIYTAYISPSASKMPSNYQSSTPIQNLSQSFNNANLSITPITTSSANTSSTSTNNKVEASNKVSVPPSSCGLTVSKTALPLEAKSTCDISPCSPVKKSETEGKIKVKPSSELLIKPTTINLIDDDDDSEVKCKSEIDYHVIDLSEKAETKAPLLNSVECNNSDVKTEPISTNPIHKSLNLGKHPDLSITPNFPANPPKSEISNKVSKSSSAGDDIQKVMEDLKVLQKMSSPKKSVIESSPTSSAVSVIAVNKSFAPKTPTQPSTMQRVDYNKGDFNTFQDEFQKQLLSALNHMSTSSPKNNFTNSTDRYPHIANSSAGGSGAENYYQVGPQANPPHKRQSSSTDASLPHKSWMFPNSNNNYAQSSNGHKSTPSAPQSGTYSILDDMFANLLTQYGYAKEATAPKSQQK